jgi:hypothetical protein
VSKGGGWYFDELKTSRSRRTVPLPASLVKSLALHKRKQSEMRLKADSLYQNKELLFATGEGSPHNSRNLTNRHFRPILKRAEVSLIFGSMTCATVARRFSHRLARIQKWYLSG